MAQWETVSSTIAYENPWIHVRHDTVIRPDGSNGLFGIIEPHNVAVFIVPVAQDELGNDCILLETINRYTVGVSVEVPAGGCDGQDPLESAQRELLEETGMRADDWTELGQTNSLNGVARAYQKVYLARGLHPAEDASESQLSEGIQSVALVPWPKVVAMIADGRISDGESISAIPLAAIHLGWFH